MFHSLIISAMVSKNFSLDIFYLDSFIIKNAYNRNRNRIYEPRQEALTF